MRNGFVSRGRAVARERFSFATQAIAYQSLFRRVDSGAIQARAKYLPFPRRESYNRDRCSAHIRGIPP